MTDEPKDEDLSIRLPVSIPRWIKGAVSGLETEIRRLKRTKNRLFDQLGDCQNSYQVLYDLVERIAEDREPNVKKACRDIIMGFNPGSYEEEAK